MPLPIPDIMQNSAAVVDAAKKLGYKPTDEQLKEVHHLSKTVNAEDILAALNEIGHVYASLHNMQILRIASAPDLQNKKFAFIIDISAGLGPVRLTIPLSVEQGEHLVKSFNETLATLAAAGNKLILSGGNA